MSMKQLRLRILGFFFLLLAVFSILFLYVATDIIEEQNLELQSQDLSAQLVTLSSQIDIGVTTEEELTELNSQLEPTAEVISERITLINLDGDVLYDTHAASGELENHADRPEVQQVLSGEEIGSFHRTSDSTGDVLYYVAAPLNNVEGEVIGILRLSRSVAEMTGVTDQLVQALFLFIGISVLVTLLFTHYWTTKIGDPIEEIKQVAGRLSHREYDARYTSSSYKEIDELGDTVNELALNLDAQMHEILQNDKRLRELINHLVIGVMLLDENRQVTMINPVMNEILGINLYGKLGHDYAEVIRSAGLAELIEKAYETEDTMNDEVSFYFQDEKIVDANVVPIPGRVPYTTNFIVLLYDITEIRRLEKVRTDFVANASHELRTPITALKGFSETLLDGAMDDKEVLIDFLNIMLKESSRLDAMVQDILQLSKLEQKKAHINMEDVNLKDVVGEVFQILHQKAELKEISLNMEEITSVHLLADHDQLKQILLNLVGNAISYTPENGKVEVEIRKQFNEAVIKVTDNGIGIPKEEQTRVFERFYRVDKARSRNAGGTGLGLSIVKWLVENMKGRIELDSQVGKGTTFTIYLPIKK